MHGCLDMEFPWSVPLQQVTLSAQGSDVADSYSSTTDTSNRNILTPVTYPLLQEATANWPATHLATELGRDATTPQPPQLAALFIRSASQPSDGSWLQSPNLHSTQAAKRHLEIAGEKI
jgi:hypothetical protein